MLLYIHTVCVCVRVRVQTSRNDCAEKLQSPGAELWAWQLGWGRQSAGDATCFLMLAVDPTGAL